MWLWVLWPVVGVMMSFVASCGCGGGGGGGYGGCVVTVVVFGLCFFVMSFVAGCGCGCAGFCGVFFFRW